MHSRRKVEGRAGRSPRGKMKMRVQSVVGTRVFFFFVLPAAHRRPFPPRTMKSRAHTNRFNLILHTGGWRTRTQGRGKALSSSLLAGESRWGGAGSVPKLARNKQKQSQHQALVKQHHASVQAVGAGHTERRGRNKVLPSHRNASHPCLSSLTSSREFHQPKRISCLSSRFTSTPPPRGTRYRTLPSRAVLLAPRPAAAACRLLPPTRAAQRSLTGRAPTHRTRGSGRAGRRRSRRGGWGGIPAGRQGRRRGGTRPPCAARRRGTAGRASVGTRWASPGGWGGGREGGNEA